MAPHYQTHEQMYTEMELLRFQLQQQRERAEAAEHTIKAHWAQRVQHLESELRLRQLPDVDQVITAEKWRHAMLSDPYVLPKPQACRSCGARIAWVNLKNSPKAHPVDLDAWGRPAGTHFATCPHASSWRAKKDG